MKPKYYTNAILLVMLLAVSGLSAQPIVAYTDLFTFDTRIAQVQGIITDDCSGNPISSAVIAITGIANSYTANSASDGAYVIDQVPTGNYEFSVTKDGYVLYSHEKFISSEPLQQINAELTRFINQHLPIINLIIADGSANCNEALESITVSGLTLTNASSLNLIAGQQINIQPDSYVESGSQFHAFIDASCYLCSQELPLLSSAELTENSKDLEPIEPELKFKQTGVFFSLFPNPTSGTFALELPNHEESTIIHIEIYNMLGSKILSTELPAQPQLHFSLAGQQQGIYLVRVSNGSEARTIKLIMQ